MIRTVPLVLCLVLASCTAQDAQLATIDTCQTNAAIVSSLAGVRAQLSTSTQAKVDQDISVIDPICSAPNPPATLTGLAGSAAQDLAQILASATGAKK